MKVRIQFFVTIPGNWDLSISIGSDRSSGKNLILWIRIVFPEKLFSTINRLLAIREQEQVLF